MLTINATSDLTVASRIPRLDIIQFSHDVDKSLLQFSEFSSIASGDSHEHVARFNEKFPKKILKQRRENMQRNIIGIAQIQSDSLTLCAR